MEKILTYFVLVLAICGCGGNSDHRRQADTVAVKPLVSIVPGERIGKVSIGENVDSVLTVLGKPDFSDAAMGSMVMRWFSAHDTTSVFASRNYDGSPDEHVAHVRRVLVTSPAFKTAEGLSTGLSLAEYQQYFDLRLVGRNKGMKVYMAKGITFEIDSVLNKGMSIIVHQPADSAYINMH